jgi:hypothetical protein
MTKMVTYAARPGRISITAAPDLGLYYPTDRAATTGHRATAGDEHHDESTFIIDQYV